MASPRGLLNSNVVIDYDRDTVTDPENQIGALEWLESKIDEGWEFFVSEITVLEMLKGFACKQRAKKEEFESFKERLSVFLQSVASKLPITPEISERAENLFLELCRQCTPQKSESIICDMLIAATALEHGLVLFTFNKRDFEWINNLNVEEPDYRRLGENESSNISR